MPEYDATELILHYNIRCNNCKIDPIIGFRYKCVQCPDYDLCGNCESQHKHPEHLMLRLLTMIYPGGPDEFILHDGVSCDGCGSKPIIGYRYKCMECPNYDLCQKCEMQKKHFQHMMVRFSKHNRSAANDNAGDDVNTVHCTVSCDICKCEPIVGFRYKCLNCFNFDLCEKCEAQHKHSGHVLVRLLNNQSSAQYDKVTHDRVRCDSCWTSSIQGFRYMCLQCDDFDLCEKCEGRHKHANHIMLRLPNNKYFTSFVILKRLMAPSAEPVIGENANNSYHESSDHTPPPSYENAVSQTIASALPSTSEHLNDFQTEHMREMLLLMNKFNDLLSKSCNAIEFERASSLLENIIQDRKVNSQRCQEKTSEK